MGNTMKTSAVLLFVAVLCAGTTHAAPAQSLDIGGIELHLGQKVDEALRSLSPYQVQYSGGAWYVSQKVGNMYQFLGVISARGNVISSMSKIFNANENESVAEVYTRASNEIRRQGGSNCTTREMVRSKGFRGFQTQCGTYMLEYIMPVKATDGSLLSNGSVSISIGR